MKCKNCSKSLNGSQPILQTPLLDRIGRPYTRKDFRCSCETITGCAFYPPGTRPTTGKAPKMTKAERRAERAAQMALAAAK